MLTSSECHAQAEEKIAQADRDPRNQERLLTAAQAWLILAGQMRRLEATMRSAGKIRRNDERISGGVNSLRCDDTRPSATAQENVMRPLRPDRPLPAPIWICPICQKLMRTGTIEIANGKEQTKLACATCGTQATQSEFAD